MRLDKFLTETGCGSRSQVKAEIKKGAVTINGRPARKNDQQVLPEEDRICFHGKELSYQPYEYYMLNKPKGCVSATEDQRYPTVLSLISSKRKDLFPVGRLDIDTEGLLMITNDGPLAHDLLSPKKHVPKTYYAKIDGIVTKEDIERFKKGLDIGQEKPTLPARLFISRSDSVSEVEVTIFEGKYHQVKRMFEKIGKPVLYLKRISMGPLCLDQSLLPGQWRHLTEEELIQLQKRGQDKGKA